jgi:hypothetical protein
MISYTIKLHPRQQNPWNASFRCAGTGFGDRPGISRRRLYHWA